MQNNRDGKGEDWEHEEERQDDDVDMEGEEAEDGTASPTPPRYPAPHSPASTKVPVSVSHETATTPKEAPRTYSQWLHAGSMACPCQPPLSYCTDTTFTRVLCPGAITVFLCVQAWRRRQRGRAEDDA